MSPLHWAAIALFAPLGVAFLLLVVHPLRRAGKPAAALSVLAAVVSLISALVVFSSVVGGEAITETVRWLPGDGLASRIELGLHLDGLSASMLVVVCFVATCVQIFSLGYMADEPPADFGRYFTWHSLFIFSMNSLVIAPNLLQLFLGWELVGLCSYLLIGFYYKKPSAARAALKAFWITKFADMGLLLGLIGLYATTGGFEWSAVTPHADWIAGLMFLAVMGKSAQFPLHIWLPDAMEGPTPVSALLHAATMVAAGVFLICRADPLFAQAPITLEFMTWIGAFTALFAACIAVVQDDIKKVLAYSTCSQLGYMVCALGVGSLEAGFFHLTTHAFFKALLFLGAGSLIHAVHSNSLKDMGGLFKKMKLTSITFIIGSLALAGFPGLAGFFSKDLILEEVLHKGQYVPLVALVIAAFLTAFYMGRVLVLAFFGTPSKAAEHAHEGGLSMKLPLVMLAVPAAGLGLFGGKLAEAYGGSYAFHVTPIGMVATGAGLSGLAVAWWMFSKGGGEGVRAALAPLGRVARSGALDKSYTWAFHHVVLRVSKGVAWFDRYVIDGLINASGYATLEAGARIRRLQTGNVHHYLFALVFGLLLLGAYGVFNA